MVKCYSQVFRVKLDKFYSVAELQRRTHPKTNFFGCKLQFSGCKLQRQKPEFESRDLQHSQAQFLIL